MEKDSTRGKGVDRREIARPSGGKRGLYCEIDGRVRDDTDLRGKVLLGFPDHRLKLLERAVIAAL